MTQDPASPTVESRKGDRRSFMRWWWSSLPVRIIVSTMVGSIVVVLLGGYVIMQQASEGIIKGKRMASINEASLVLSRMQLQLRETDLRTASLYERLNQLADETGSQSEQFSLVIQGPISTYVSPGISAESVPRVLVDAVSPNENDMFVTPTVVIRSDGTRLPGIAVGGHLYAPGPVAPIPVFFIFQLDHEEATLTVIEQALWTAGTLLLVLLTAIAVLVSRHVVRPIRQASITAGRLADGQLDERMRVRGSDDLASLATSMNHMASELQQQIVQLEELSRVQRQFVSDVSHELRTPLTTVRMAAEMLYEGRSDFAPSVARAMELMHDELDRFEALLSDLLEISRFDAGAAVITRDEVDLVDVVTAEVEAQRAFAERMGTTLRLHVGDEAVAELDARRIRRILRNLITNAIEHAERQPIDITVASDEDAVAVVVRDHGVGFMASQARQVFHRFWRADPSRNRTVGGTGLGLSISMEDALLHHGWLSAWGRPHRGAQFRLTLPRRPDHVLRSSPLPLAPTDVTLSRVSRPVKALSPGPEDTP